MMEMKKGLHGKEIYEAKKDPQFQKPYVDVDESNCRTGRRCLTVTCTVVSRTRG